MPTGRQVHPITPPQFLRQHILRMEVREIADAIGVTGSIWSRYEAAGHIPEHHWKKLKQLAKERCSGLKVPESWFAAVPFATGVPI